MQKAKKFGRQGRYGQGSEIDRETYDYFLKVLQDLDRINKEDKADVEEKTLFVTNVLQSTNGQESILSCNQLASRVLEKLLPFAEEKARRTFRECLSDDIRKFATNAFASHVLESLVISASTVTPDQSQEESEVKREWLLKMSKYCVNNFEDFACDPYASHLLRTCLSCVAGQPLLGKRADLPAKLTFVDPDEDSLEILRLASTRAQNCERNFVELAQLEHYSGVLQSLLQVLGRANSRELKALGKYVLSSLHLEDGGHQLDCQPVCRLVEVLVVVSGQSLPKLFSKVASVFVGRLAELSVDSQKNFAVQKLLNSCPDKETFEQWYEEELDANVEKILQSGNSGVILALAQGCRRLAAKQAHFLVSLMKSLGCHDCPEKQKKFLATLVALKPVDQLESNCDQSSVNLHGALLVQEILQFNKPIKLIQSLLATEPTKLGHLLSDPRGSHITDMFMTSPTIGEKSREGIIKLLKDELVNMACSKHGSRSVDALWARANPRSRELMAVAMAGQLSRLNGDQYGKFVASSLNLATFKRSKEAWKSSFEQKAKTKRMFSDFIGEEKAEKRPKLEQQPEFVIDTKGDENMAIVKKQKKVKAKSYLDDL